ncbi:MAG: gamma-glutamyltransferase, partial [Microcystaceae cyanobacterium]
MKSFQLFKHFLRVTIFLTLLSILSLILDIVVSRSLYHPLTYWYQARSWWLCNREASCPQNLVHSQNSRGSGKNSLVVTPQHKASEVGLQILAQGGNAIDAAVAVGYALAVTDPCCGNIGGGGFMLIHLAKGEDIFINFREKAPSAASPNMYLDKEGHVISGLSTKGYLAVGVPG